MKVWDTVRQHYGSWKGLDGAGMVTIVSTAAGAGFVDSRLARFDAAADMPADITSLANVTADMILFNAFSAGTRRLQMLWHGAPISWNAAAGAGPIAIGSRITVNAGDAITAAARLTYTDLTGAGTSIAGVADTFNIGPDNPFLEVVLDSDLLDVYAIGIPLGFTPTNIVSSFLELRGVL